MLKKIISTLIATSIIYFGIGKTGLETLFGNWILNLLEVFEINPPTQVDFTGTYLERNWTNNKLGLFLYYPIYYLLHVTFIIALFKQHKTKKNLIAVLTMTIVILLISRILFIKLGYTNLTYMTRRLFHTLFGLPFIMLAIEGGKILISDINKRLNQ